MTYKYKNKDGKMSVFMLEMIFTRKESLDDMFESCSLRTLIDQEDNNPHISQTKFTSATEVPRIENKSNY